MKRRYARGVSLAVALLLLLMLSVFCLTLGSLGIYHLHHIKNYAFSTAARYAAVAGVQESAAMLYGDPSWTAGFAGQSLMAACGTYTVTFGPSSPYRSVNNFSGATMRMGWGGVSVPPGYAHIIAVGNVNGCIQRVAATIRKPIPGPAWKYAVFAEDGITFKGGGSIRSFDSSAGSYPYPVDNGGGDIGTNSTERDSIRFGGTSDVFGDIYIGPGGNVATAIDPPGGGSHVKGGGTAQTLASLQEIPAMVDFVRATSRGDRSYSGGGDYGTLPPGKYDELVIQGNGTLHLTAGNYSFSRISQAATATLQIDGASAADAARIFVRGTADTNDIDIDISGGGIQNSTYKPTKCFVYGGNLVTSVRFTGSSQGYWAMFTPGADAVQTGTQDVWGGVICRSYLQAGNGSVKYDRSLGRVRDTGTSLYPQILTMYHLDSEQRK